MLAPRPDMRTTLPRGQRRINHVYARYDSIRGTIESGWDRVGESIVYKFTVPAGTVAQVSLVGMGDALSVNDVKMTREELVADVLEGKWSFKLGAGKYIIK